MKSDGLTLVIAVLLFVVVARLIWRYVNYIYEVPVFKKKLGKHNFNN